MPDAQAADQSTAQRLGSPPPPATSPPRRLRDFLAVSALALICITVIVGVGLNRVLEGMVLDEARQLSVNVCNALSDLELRPYMKHEVGQPAKLVITAEDVTSLDRRMRAFLSHFEIVKVKVFDRTSTIRFSTDLRIIGHEDPGSRSLASALAGQGSSKLEHDEDVWDHPSESRAGVDVVETYIPIRADAGQVIGAVEVYLDVTSARRQARSTLVLAIGVVALVLAVAFTGLSVLMYNAERTIRVSELALRRHETRLRAILDRAADGIVLCDHQLAILSLNPAATQLFGYHEQSLRGRHLRTLLARLDDTSHAVEPSDIDIALTEQPSLDCLGRRADQSLFPMRLLTTTIGIGDGAMVAAIMHDLTLTRQLQEQQRARDLERAQHMNHIAQLATGVAHELRNPLTSVKLLVQQQRETSDVPAELAEDLAIIEDEILRMERSLQTFLDFARPAAPVYAPVDLHDVLQTVRALVEGRIRRQHITYHPPDKADLDCTVHADRDQIRQILLNLFLNALDVMPDGGQLAVTLQRDEQDIHLHVADSGPGIDPAIRARLFEPFATTKEAGVGLGLVVSRRIAREHGGDLAVRMNTDSPGACFVLRLPIVHARASRQGNLSNASVIR